MASLPSSTPGKNVLIVLSHPEKTSFSHALAATAREVLESTGHSVVVSDLYAMGFDPVNDRRNFVSCKDSTRLNQQAEEANAVACGGFSVDIQAEMDKIVWCDYLIFHCPIHWFGLPAMLKGWCDKVLASGFAYGGGRWYDTGRFLGKKALLCMTTGAPEFMYKADHIQGDIRDITFPITHGIFWFCGFTPLQSYFVYSPSHGTDENRVEMLNQWRQYVTNLDSAPTIRYRGFTDVVRQHKEASAPSAPLKYSQKCFCGAVESGSNADPIIQAYCHCKDCQEYTGCPFVPIFGFPAGTFVVTKGAQHVKTINKVGRLARRFCGLCSTMVVNDPVGYPIQTASAVNLKCADVTFKPQCHVNYADKFMSIKDGLPKFKTFGGPDGSGELMEE